MLIPSYTYGNFDVYLTRSLLYIRRLLHSLYSFPLAIFSTHHPVLPAHPLYIPLTSLRSFSLIISSLIFLCSLFTYGFRPSLGPFLYFGISNKHDTCYLETWSMIWINKARQFMAISNDDEASLESSSVSKTPTDPLAKRRCVLTTDFLITSPH